MANTYLELILAQSSANKYSRWYTSIVIRALGRASDRKSAKAILGYTESHHILPKSFNLGGANDRSNIVFLTAKEHFIVHCLLVKMTTGRYKSKMVFALQRLRQTNVHQERRYFNSKLYEHFKRHRPKFTRIYLADKVKYIPEGEEVQPWLDNGWSTLMTAEYKNGRVGMMKGRKHSQLTKQRMSDNHARPWLGKKVDAELVERRISKIRGKARKPK